MADTVQIMMEKMIPELEDLQEKKIFSPDEIRQIVDKRREFEYMMKRIPLRTIDGLRYIEYELNLDALRAKRKERAGLKKMSISDFAGVRRVHNIFERILYKHRGSIELWLQYIDFCKNEGSGKILSHVFSRALQVHPRSDAIWIEAASYEFSTNLSVDSARILMQRAIRLNKHCQRLWHEYFRLELLYIQKLAVRRQVLQLNDENATDKTNAEDDDGTTVRLDPLDEEHDKNEEVDAVREATEKQKTRDAILKGAIPRIVFTNAIATIPQDVAFRLKFMEISDLFGPMVSELSESILESCLQDFPSSELVHQAKALRQWTLATADAQSDDAIATAERHVVAAFETSLDQVPTAAMKEAFEHWIVQRLASKRTSFMTEYATTTLEKLAMNTPFSYEVSRVYLEFLARTKGLDAALTTVQSVLDGAKDAAQCASMWLLYVQLLLQQRAEPVEALRSSKRRRVDTTNTKSPVDMLSILNRGRQSLQATDAHGRFLLSQRSLELQIAANQYKNEDIEAAFMDALQSQAHGTPEYHALRRQLMDWAAMRLPLHHTRRIYQQLMDGTPMLATDATYAFLLQCIDAETSVVEAAISMDHVRRLFEKLVDLFGQQTEAVWIQFIRFYTARGLFADANKIHHRALRTCASTEQLNQLVLTAGAL